MVAWLHANKDCEIWESGDWNKVRSDTDNGGNSDSKDDWKNKKKGKRF